MKADSNENIPAKPKTNAAEILVACTACGKKLKVKEELVGKRVKCPHCGAAVRVPARA